VTNVPPLTPLTQPADRSRANAIVAGRLRCTTAEAAAILITVDALSASVLGVAGLDEASIRAAMAALWEHPVRSAPAGDPTSRLRVTDREREFLRDLGVRIRVVRQARRLEPPAIRRATSIPGDQLVDVERGIAIPTVLALYRLGDTLQIPLPLLIDEKQAPIDLLQQLAARERAGE
jgi:CBS-domain-containing membrane protein